MGPPSRPEGGLLDDARLAGPTRSWTPRARGGTLADAAVKSLFETGDIAAVNQLMRSLVTNDGLPPETLPPVIRDYLAATPRCGRSTWRRCASERTCSDCTGRKCSMVLGFYSLPASYAAKKGVQVLYRTAYLTNRPVRRVLETSQMVIDVMAPTASDPNGRGIAWPRRYA